MKKRLKLQEIKVKSFTTSGKEATGGTLPPTQICTSPHRICNSVDNPTACNFCFP